MCCSVGLSLGKGSCTVPDLALLIGDGTVEATLVLIGRRGACSKKFPGCRDVLLGCCERLDVLRRSWFCPALNCTRRGDEGFDPLLGDEFV